MMDFVLIGDEYDVLCDLFCDFKCVEVSFYNLWLITFLAYSFVVIFRGGRV